MAISVVPSIMAEIPTPLPPPVTVTAAPGYSFINVSAHSWVRGRTVSLPLMRCADIDSVMKRTRIGIKRMFLYIFYSIDLTLQKSYYNMRNMLHSD